MTKQIPWLRVSLEGIVIVGSILLAFTLDAWWQERATRDWEFDQLHALRAEFAGNGELLDDAVGRHDQKIQDVAQILKFLQAARPGDKKIYSDRVLSSLVAWNTSDISTGTLNALLASGGLGDIRDDRLRSELAAWPTVVADAQEDESLARDFVEMVLAPALFGMGVLPAAYAAREGPGGDDFVRSPPDAKTEIEFDPTLRDVAAVRLLHLRLASASMAALGQRTTAMVALIDEAIGGR
ncbi:MAG: hypothetical protein ACC682_12150 [Gemmatimonadota bacterium]